MLNTMALFSGGFGWGEILLLAAIGLLIFGRRLPEVGKSLGKGIVEFKKGLTGIEDEIDQAGGDQGPPTLSDRSGDTAADHSSTGTEQIDRDTSVSAADTKQQSAAADQPGTDRT